MKKYSIKDLIRVASEEYKINGASPLFEVCQNMVIESKDPKSIYLFAKFVKGAHIGKLEEAICQTNNAKYMFFFANEVNFSNPYVIAESFVTAKGARTWRSNFTWFVEDGAIALDRADAIQYQKEQEALENKQLNK
ncbi:MAG: hypothetical protein K6F08_02120 [bacterium]|nr:hypothetical protein [bacterium]